MDRVIPTHVSNGMILATIQRKLPGNPLWWEGGPDTWEAVWNAGVEGFGRDR